jgi:hypothetical protein
MHHKAEPTDQRENDKTDRYDVADYLVGQQHYVFPSDKRVELALADVTLAKVKGNFLHLQRPRR